MWRRGGFLVGIWSVVLWPGVAAAGGDGSAAVQIVVFTRDIQRQLERVARALPDFTDRPHQSWEARRTYRYSIERTRPLIQGADEFPATQDRAMRKWFHNAQLAELVGRLYRVTLRRISVNPGRLVTRVEGDIRWVSHPAAYYLTKKERAARDAAPESQKGSWQAGADRRKDAIEKVHVVLHIDASLSRRIDRDKLRTASAFQFTIAISDFTVRGIERFGGYAAMPRLRTIEATIIDVDPSLTKP